MDTDQPPFNAETRQDAADARQAASDERASTSNEALQEIVGSLATTVDKIAESIDNLREDSQLTRDSLAKLSASNMTLASKNRQKVGVIVTLAALVVVAGVFGWRLQEQSTCFSNWANSSTNRTSILVPLSNTRNTKLRLSVMAEHTALHFALTHPGGAPADVTTLITDLGKWDTATSDFLTADSNYAQAVANNPVPDSPKFDCPAF